MNENLRLIPKAAETIFKGGITLLKIISLRGASCFQRDFFASLGGACGFTASEEEGTPVTYSCGYGEIPPEGYMLELKGDCAELRASDYGGLFYGFVTLAQLIHNYGGEVPSVTVRDRPSLNYRGLMLDVARYFFDKEDIFRFADFCASYGRSGLENACKEIPFAYGKGRFPFSHQFRRTSSRRLLYRRRSQGNNRLCQRTQYRGNT